jgi:outer membrane protein assembly factor BamD (BamD/ComL family)
MRNNTTPVWYQKHAAKLQAAKLQAATEEEIKALESTAFSELSEEAQELIVDTVLGMYKNQPPTVSASVRAELEAWVYLPE